MKIGKTIKINIRIKSICNKGLLALAFVALVLTSATNQASALTIGGTEYDKILSGSLDGYFGIWKYYQKGTTYTTHPTDLTVRVNNTTLLGDTLAGKESASRFESNFMTNSGTYFGAVTAGEVKINGATGNSLLKLEYLSNGLASGVLALGAAGEANLVGLYRVTGGSWLTPGTLIYSTLNFAAGSGYAKNDFYFSNGTFNLYAAHRSENEVPEPATSALLLSSLVGAAIRKKSRSSTNLSE